MAPEIAQYDRLFMVGRPPDRSERRLAGIIVSLSALFFFLTVPFATTPLIPLWAFIPLYQAALAVCTLITAGFFFAMFSILRSRALLVLGCGYLFTALMVVPHSLTFPGLFTDSGLLGAGPQSTAWLYIFWHGTFPLFIIAYALLKNRRAPVTPFRASSRISLADGIIATVILAASLTLLATDGHDLLPPLIVDGVYTSEMKVASAIVWLLNPLALMVLWARRPHSILDLWLMVAMCAWTFDVALSTLFNATRFDLGFYVGRVYGLLAATFVLLVLLVGTAGLYARVRRPARHREAGARAHVGGPSRLARPPRCNLFVRRAQHPDAQRDRHNRAAQPCDRAALRAAIGPDGVSRHRDLYRFWRSGRSRLGRAPARDGGPMAQRCTPLWRGMPTARNSPSRRCSRK